MTPFATDADLLHWEPGIFIDGASVSQTLMSGTGALAGTTFTIAEGSFEDAHIDRGHVVVLDAPVAGSFPVFKVNSPTELLLTVLYDDLHPSAQEEDPDPISPGEGTGLNYRIRTFSPQRQSVSEQLLQAAGVKSEEVSTIINPQVFRRPCVLGTLQMIYIALAANADDPTPLLVRAELFERLYQRAIRAAVVEIDTDNDGAGDEDRELSVARLRRV